MSAAGGCAPLLFREERDDDFAHDLGGRLHVGGGLVEAAVGDFFIGAGGAHVDGELDEVGFEIPLPAVLVGEHGVGVIGKHRERAMRGLIAEAGELLHDHFVDAAIVGEAVFDVDFVEAGEVDDFAGFDGGAASEGEQRRGKREGGETAGREKSGKGKGETHDGSDALHGRRCKTRAQSAGLRSRGGW